MRNQLLNKIIVLCVASLFWFSAAGAVPSRLHKDTSQIKPYALTGGKLDTYRSDSHFKYQEVRYTPGFFDRLMNWLLQFRWIRGILNLSPNLVKIILILVFIFLLTVLFRGRIQGIFLSNRQDQGDLGFENEISDQIPLESMLREAEKEGNYNLAVRYLYLIVLRNLNRQGRITYQPGKTNFQYQMELGNTDLTVQFRKLTREYEYAWYGHFIVHAAAYQQISTEYRSLSGGANG